MSPRVVVVSGVYPTRAQPELGAFVAAMVRAMHGNGTDVEVVAPQSLASLARGAGRSAPREVWPVHRPRFVSFSARLLPMRDIGTRWSYYQFCGAVKRGLGGLRGKRDFVYAHFWSSGRAAEEWCVRTSTPCIAVLGESGLRGHYDRVFGPGQFARGLRGFAGVIASSEENERICREACPDLGDRLIHLPNAVDTAHFQPLDRATSRRQLGLPPDARIVAFSGHFIERKGALRVQAALRELGDVQGVFLGQGPQRPVGPEVLRAAPVSHGDLPVWLSAADAFVLPSLQEGMSNAILEAMGCGVPLVVSDRPFNRGFLDEECAVLVDPEYPTAIAAGLRRVWADPAATQKRTQAARKRVGRFTLSQRALALVEFGRRMAGRSRMPGERTVHA